jgi:hypothetical protein
MKFPMIEDGTLIGKETGDVKVLEISIHKNNQGNWDSIAKVRLLNPAFRGQVTQVLLREMARSMTRGGMRVHGKEDQPPSTYRRQPGDSPCVTRGTVLRSGDTLFTAIRVAMDKNAQGEWDAAALLRYEDGGVQKTRELTMCELGQAIDSGEIQIV